MDGSERSAPEELHPPLIELMRDHGIHAQADGPWIVFPKHSGRLRGTIFSPEDGHPSCSTQLDFHFSPWPGCDIVESFAGTGESREAQIRTALNAFAQNVLHVWLRTFFNINDDVYTNEWSVTNNGVLRKVTDGNVLFRFDDPSVRSVEWFEGFEQLIASHPLPEGTHWVRMFYAQNNSQPVALELLLDNEPWTGALPAAGKLQFLKTASSYSLRIFLLIQGGSDIGRYIGIIAQNPQADDSELEKLLISTGLSIADARRMLLLIPAAFSQVFLSRRGVKIPPMYLLSSGRSKTNVNLRSSPLYCQLTRIAGAFLTEGRLSDSEILNVVGRCNI